MQPVSSITESQSEFPRSAGSGSLDLHRPKESRWFGPAAIIWVALFGLLLASFPARNVDLWGRLASGRDIIHGQSFFVQAAGGAWLFDVAVFELFAAVGGSGLNLAKALLVAFLGFVLMRHGRLTSSWWLPAVCTGLALLAMGTRLLLQPATLSFLLLALALWLAYSPQAEQWEHCTVPAIPWALLALMLIWANLDTWFVLALAVIALAWLGSAADAAIRGRLARNEVVRHCIFWIALVAVCFVNPAHVRAFRWPRELNWTFVGAAVAPGRVSSPFQSAYFDLIDNTPAGLGYFPLLGLGALSFLINLKRWRWERFLPWLGLALLSAFEVRTIPFFAVVSAPILSWNLQEFFVRRTSRLVLAVGRGGSAALGIVFLIAAWPGWLQAPPFGPRRWTIETPASLERGAATVYEWRRDGRLKPDQKGMHLSSDSAQVFAWFLPDEKPYRDERAARVFVAAPSSIDELSQAMRSAKANHIYVYDRDRTRLFGILSQLLAAPKEWPILFMEGDFVIFGWRDPNRIEIDDPFRDLELDLDGNAFNTLPHRRAPARPADPHRPRRWWDAFFRSAPTRTVDRDEATLLVLYAEAQRQLAPLRHLDAWESNQAAGLVGAAGSWMSPTCLLDCQVRLVLQHPPLPQGDSKTKPSPLSAMTLQLQRPFAFERDDSSAALLYGAVRACRRAVAADPNDSQAWLNLGECYLRLLHNTRERGWGQRFPELGQLRLIQASAALNRALTLKPDLAQAHLSIGAIYGQLGYVDLSLEHQRKHAELLRDAAKRSSPESGRFQDTMAEENQRLAQRTKDVQSRLSKFAELAPTMRVYDRAQTALQMGLAGKARDILLESDIAAFGSQGMALELELLLKTGRAADVRDWTSPEQKGTLGESSYHWFRVQAFAALGDYASANEEAQLLAVADRDTDDPRTALALSLGRALTDVPPLGDTIPNAARRAVDWFDLRSRVSAIARYLRHEADVHTLRGLLALEQGDVAEAEAAFHQALAVWQNEAAAATGAGLDFSGRVVAQDCLEWLADAVKPAR